MKTSFLSYSINNPSNLNAKNTQIIVTKWTKNKKSKNLD